MENSEMRQQTTVAVVAYVLLQLKIIPRRKFGIFWQDFLGPALRFGSKILCPAAEVEVEMEQPAHSETFGQELTPAVTLDSLLIGSSLTGRERPLSLLSNFED